MQTVQLSYISPGKSNNISFCKKLQRFEVHPHLHLTKKKILPQHLGFTQEVPVTVDIHAAGLLPDTSGHQRSGRSPSLQKDQTPKIEVPDGSHKTDPRRIITTQLADPETPGTHPPSVFRRPNLTPPQEKDTTLGSITAASETPVQIQPTPVRAKNPLTVSHLR